MDGRRRYEEAADTTERRILRNFIFFNSCEDILYTIYIYIYRGWNEGKERNSSGHGCCRVPLHVGQARMYPVKFLPVH